MCVEAFSTGGDYVPRILPCGHTLCFKCCAKQNPRQCPACRAPMPANNQCDGLPTNYVLITMIDSLAEAATPPCSNAFEGEDTHATHFCLQCAKNLCRFCEAVHSRQKSSKLHVLLNDFSKSRDLTALIVACKDLDRRTGEARNQIESAKNKLESSTEKAQGELMTFLSDLRDWAADQHNYSNLTKFNQEFC